MTCSIVSSWQCDLVGGVASWKGWKIVAAAERKSEK